MALLSLEHAPFHVRAEWLERLMAKYSKQDYELVAKLVRLVQPGVRERCSQDIRQGEVRRSVLPNNEREMTMKEKKAKENKLFPGRPNYTGSNEGYFAMLHHELLFESTVCYKGGVKERIGYVMVNKAKKEVPIRLRNMVCLNNMPGIEPLLFLMKIDQRLRKAIEDPHISMPSFECISSVHSDIRVRRERMERALGKEVLRYLDKVFPKHAWDAESGGIIGTLGHPRRKRRK